MSGNEKYNFKFYDWEEKLRDKPFLRQPFGDKWEEYTWQETGQMARKLATGLKSAKKCHTNLSFNLFNSSKMGSGNSLNLLITGIEMSFPAKCRLFL